MSLSVTVFQRNATGEMVIADDSRGAGFESWRTRVWGSEPVKKLVETVRRPKPSRVLLPSLAFSNLEVEGEELDQLEREIDLLLQHVPALVTELHGDGSPIVGVVIGDGVARTGTTEDARSSLRNRLENIQTAIRVARTLPHGRVIIW